MSQARLAALTVRITQARDSGRVAKWEHVTRLPNGAIAGIACKGCGLPIRRLQPVRVGSRTYRQSLPEETYAERVMLLDEGPGRPPGMHVTHVCRQCAERDWPLDTLEAFFLADVAAWLDRPDALTDPSLLTMLVDQATRRVVGWRRPLTADESPHRGGNPVQEALDAR